MTDVDGAGARQDILDVFAGRERYRALIGQLQKCGGTNCGKCGDLCPLASRNRRRDLMQKVIVRFGRETEVSHISFSAAVWVCRAKQLKSMNVQSVAKLFRRSFNRLHQPASTAVCTVGALWNSRNAYWQVSVQAIIAGPTQEELEIIQNGTLCVESVIDLNQVVKAVVNHGSTPRDFNGALISSRNRRREYYKWLAQVDESARTFRIGLDRHFHPLRKSGLTKTPKPTKGHPFPRWLMHCFYGSHEYDCKCNICLNRRN
jgi:hypothetical protein